MGELHAELTARIRRAFAVDAACWHGLDPDTKLLTTANPVELLDAGFITPETEASAAKAVVARPKAVFSASRAFLAVARAVFSARRAVLWPVMTWPMNRAFVSRACHI